MAFARILQRRLRDLIKCAAGIAAIFLAAAPCGAQSAPPEQGPESRAVQELDKYPGLLPEIGQLFGKLQSNVHFPPPRAESRLLPLLPPSTVSYAAFPNYGDAAHQALQVFRRELQSSSPLSDWWRHGELATTGPRIEDSLEKFYQLHEFLGEEIVVSSATEGRKPSVLVVAQVRKPGLKKFLQQTVSQLASGSNRSVRVLDLQELGNARDTGAAEEFVVLVRPDFVVGALDLATLRSFSASLDRHSREFASTPFGQRVAQEYRGGLTVLAAADMHRILAQSPAEMKQSVAFQRSGFADMKYFIWEHKNVGTQTVSQSELSFSGPRRGSASWLANSHPLPSLDFVSPSAIMGGAVALANPAQIFDEAKELADSGKPNFFTQLPQAERALGFSLRDDLLSHLGGEFTLELDSIIPPRRAWKAILSVRDAGALQRTLDKLLAAHFPAEQVDEGGITYHTVRIPARPAPVEIGYALADGYLIIGSGRDAVAGAVQLHKTGGSLAKSPKFLASLPPGHSLDASALFFENPIAMTALRLRQLAPEMAESLEQSSKNTAPAVLSLYGENTAIREASSSAAFDVGAILVVAAAAIPNILRSKMAANEATAVGSMRTVNTAQVVYAATYPHRGFAPYLAALGPDPRNPYAQSPEHAGLVDATLANESCTTDAWCVKSGFRFRLAAVCKEHVCKEYVVVAAPVNDSSGRRNFCSTSDGVIHARMGPPLTSPVTAAECKAWPPLQ
jgi:hypothetical protein